MESVEDRDGFDKVDPVIVTLMSSFDARIEKLEQPKVEGVAEKIQKKLSFIALAIGILLSAISLFDVFWNKPQESLFRDMEEFNAAVNSVANLRQQMVRVQFESNNHQMVAAMNSMVMPQVLANIQYATALLPRLGDNVGVPQLVVLISEAINIYDLKSAETLVNKAVSIKSAPAMQSEAFRYKARLMFLTGRVQEGRKSFEDSLNAIRDVNAYGINGTRAYIVSDWALSELSMGDCGAASERVREFIGYVQSSQVMGNARAQLVATLRTQLEQISKQDKRCSGIYDLLVVDM